MRTKEPANPLKIRLNMCSVNDRIDVVAKNKLFVNTERVMIISERIFKILEQR